MTCGSGAWMKEWGARGVRGTRLWLAAADEAFSLLMLSVQQLLDDRPRGLVVRHHDEENLHGRMVRCRHGEAHQMRESLGLAWQAL